MSTSEGAVLPAEPDPAGLGPPAKPREPPLPLVELERAMGPIRRTVGFATSPKGGSSVRYLGANLIPYARRAAALDLPAELRERVLQLEQRLDGFDGDSTSGQQRRLADLFAILSRIDTLAGLPVPDLLRPVPKIAQRDEPEPPAEPTAGPRPAQAVVSPPSTRASAPQREGSLAPAAERDIDEEDADGLAEFAGDLSQPLAELVPIEFAAALAACGIDTVRDLMLIRPRITEHLETIYGAGREIAVGRAAVGGRIRASFTTFARNRPPERWSVLVGAGPTRVAWASPPPECWRACGERVVVVGTYTGAELRDAEVVRSDGHAVRLATWELPEVSDAALRALWQLLAEGLSQVRDPLPSELLRRLDLQPLGAAIDAAHGQLTEAGRRRLSFDEVLLAQIAGILPRLAPGSERGLVLPVLHGAAGKMCQLHDLVLYDDAQMHLEEIKRDMHRPTPMRRVLTGEVGAGKGLIALLAAATAADAKAQVLFIGPDAAEIENRFLFSEPLLKDAGIVARLLPSQPSKNQLEAIKRGEVHIIFGTHELLEQSIEFRRLGLIVAVEREQFGRASVLHSHMPAPRPDLLVLTSVPVGPRVLLTAYADHHLSLVTDPERRPARIAMCRPDGRAEAYRAVREAVAAGFQALVVFPMVDGQDAVDIPGALRLVRALETDMLPGLRVGLLHGALSREERGRVHEDFLHRRLDVLVSTTRVEDGPAIPSVAAVVLEQADRFDQWRLHRIIGHLSRASPQVPDGRARAILVVGEMAEPDASARIERVLAAPNGVQLTESLVALRGIERTVAPGHPPLPSLRWFEFDTDLTLLFAAREEAHRLLRDGGLRRGVGLELSSELRARWELLFPGGAERGWVCPIREEPPDPRRRRRRRRRKK